MTTRTDRATWVDRTARLRGWGAVKHMHCVSLGRTMRGGESIRRDGLPAFECRRYSQHHRGIDIFSEHIDIDCHGTINTHIDGLGHMVVPDHAPPNGSTRTPEPDPSIMRWAESGLVTRGILLDIPHLRDTRWVSGDAPVSGDEVEQALRATGVRLAHGDALLVYTGRDRYESAGHSYQPGDITPGARPGLDASAAEWLADNAVSMLCWDMLDAIVDDGAYMPVHRVAAAIGLILVDNCDLGPAAEAAHQLGTSHGMLIIAPLKIPGATGCPVNPLLVL